MPKHWVYYGTINEARTRKIKAICSIKQAESQPTQGSMAKYDQLKEADSWERIKKAWKTPSMLLWDSIDCIDKHKEQQADRAS